jgi:biopolymer transport protein ExbD
MRADHHGWTRTVVKWPNRIHSGIDAYTLGGLTFVLLIIFMVAMPNRGHHWGPDLPRARYATPMPRAVLTEESSTEICKSRLTTCRTRFERALEVARTERYISVRTLGQST